MFLGVLSLDLVCISVLYSCWVQVLCQIHELSIPTWCLASCLMYLLKRILVKSSFSFLPVQFLLFLFWTSSLACSKDLKTSNVTLYCFSFDAWCSYDLSRVDFRDYMRCSGLFFYYYFKSFIQERFSHWTLWSFVALLSVPSLSLSLCPRCTQLRAHFSIWYLQGVSV